MATQILSLHWKSARLLLIPFVIGAFALPVLSVQSLGFLAADPESFRASALVETAQLWMPFFPLLAATLGITLGITAWSWDHRQEHVYALSLPLARWEYALLKMGGGVVLALVPVAAFMVGSLAATAMVTVPEGLEAYPVALTLRFMFATLLAYAFVFALAAGTVRTVVIVASGFVATLVVGDLALNFLEGFNPGLQGESFTEWVMEALVQWPGPMRVFLGNWMLIDV